MCGQAGGHHGETWQGPRPCARHHDETWEDPWPYDGPYAICQTTMASFGESRIHGHMPGKIVNMGECRAMCQAQT